MKLCLVTAFPPSRQGLNEYGFHLAQELSTVPGIELTILADEGVEIETCDFDIRRCWQFDALSNPWRILAAVREVKPDIVWFNLGFASFGSKPVAACLGLLTPALLTLFGFCTHVTLHQLMETVDLGDAGVRFPALYRMAGYFITRILLMADSVSVLLPSYRELLRDRYGTGMVLARQHGVFVRRPEFPDLNQRGNPTHTLLAFGKWGTYKKIEPVLEAFERISPEIPNLHLIIAGGNHPKTPGYVERLAEQCAGRDNIEFTGYVDEDRIGELFSRSSLTILPYSSSAGSSGVAHLACTYGVPIVAPAIGDFRQLAEEEQIALRFYEPGSIESMVSCLREILTSRSLQESMALQNYRAAMRSSMSTVVRTYLDTFLQCRQLDSLRAAARLRRMPRWLPMRSRIARLLLRNQSWPGDAMRQHERLMERLARSAADRRSVAGREEGEGFEVLSGPSA